MSLISLKYLTLIQLKEIAKNHNIYFPANARKAEIISILENSLPEDYNILKHFSNSILSQNDDTNSVNISTTIDRMSNFDSALFDVTNNELNNANKNQNIKDDVFDVNSKENIFKQQKPRFGPGCKTISQKTDLKTEIHNNSNNIIVDKNGFKFTKGYDILNKIPTKLSDTLIETNYNDFVRRLNVDNPNKLLTNPQLKQVKGTVFFKDNGNMYLQDDNKNIYSFSPSTVNKLNLKHGDYINAVIDNSNIKASNILYIINCKTKTQNILKSTLKTEGIQTQNTKASYLEAEAIYPNKKILNEELENLSVFTRMLDIICPIAYGQRILIVANRKSGLTSMLKEFVLDLSRNNNDELIFASINASKEEQNNIAKTLRCKLFASSFSNSYDSHISCINTAIDYAISQASNGQNVVFALDDLSSLINAHNIANAEISANNSIYNYQSIDNAKKVFSIAKNTKYSGTITIITSINYDSKNKLNNLIVNDFINNSSIEIYLDKSLSENYMFPAIDLKKTISSQAQKILSQEQYDLIIKLKRIFNTISTKEAHKQFIDLLLKTSNNRELRKKIPEWYSIWEKIVNY